MIPIICTGLKYYRMLRACMSATETRIPVSKATRQELQILKAKKEAASYDETIQSLLDKESGQ